MDTNRTHAMILIGRRVILVTGLLLMTVASWAQATVVIKGARIVPGDGPVIERGTIVIQGDRITGVGADVDVGVGAQVIDGTGLTVYPGLIDTFCLAGIAAPPSAPPPQSQRSPPR